MAAAEGEPLRGWYEIDPGSNQRRRQSDAHQHRHGQIGAAPAHELGDVERPRAGADQRQAIAELQARGHHALPVGGGCVDAPAVDDHVLRGGCESDQKRRRDGESEAGGGVAKRDTHQPNGRGELRQHHPAAAAPEKARQQWDVVAIDDGRPQEFQRIGERHPAQHADLGARDSGLSKPGRERAEHEKERQSGGKAQRQHQGDAAIREKIAQTETASGFCHGSPFGSGRRAHGSHANAANRMSIVVPKRCGEVKDIARALPVKPVQRRLRRSAPRCGAQVPERPKDARETPARRRCSA